MKVGIAGAGAVAQAMARALRECGGEIACIGSRDPKHADAAARFVAGGSRAVSYREIPLYASHVLIAVSDRAITEVAQELACGRGVRVALHTCGGYGEEALAPLSAAGASCGSIHPLQSIREGSQGAADLREAYFGICGDPEALIWAEEIGMALSGRVLRIAPGARAFYHAAAVMASNYIAALLDSAEELMLLAGVPAADALRALGPLARTSLENAVRHGPVQALTGPVVRGDAETVAQHSRAVQAAGESVAGLYRAAGLRALDMARRRGLSAEDAERVRDALLARE